MSTLLEDYINLAREKEDLLPCYRKCKQYKKNSTAYKICIEKCKIKGLEIKIKELSWKKGPERGCYEEEIRKSKDRIEKIKKKILTLSTSRPNNIAILGGSVSKHDRQKIEEIINRTCERIDVEQVVPAIAQRMSNVLKALSKERAAAGEVLKKMKLATGPQRAILSAKYAEHMKNIRDLLATKKHLASRITNA